VIRVFRERLGFDFAHWSMNLLTGRDPPSSTTA
jgi:hypothetical protein